jgi:hypothetical protein
VLGDEGVVRLVVVLVSLFMLAFDLLTLLLGDIDIASNGPQSKGGTRWRHHR